MRRGASSYPHELRGKMGLQAGVMGAWGIFSQVASGWLAESSWHYPFALFLVALPLLPFVLLGLPEPQRVSSRGGEITESQVPISYQAYIIGFFSFVAMGLFVMVQTQAPFFFGHQFGIGPASIGILVSVLTGASSLTSLSLALLKGRFSHKIILCFGFLCMTFGFLMLGLSTSWLVLAGGMAAIGCGIGSIVPCISAWIAELTPPHYRGRAMGLLMTVNYLGQFSIPLWGQQLLDPYGYEGLFLTAAGVAFVCFLSVILSLRNPHPHGTSQSVEIAPSQVPARENGQPFCERIFPRGGRW